MTTPDVLTPARVSPPGRIISRELEARGWTQRDLARIMMRPPQAVNEIVRGTKQITPETAIELSEAFGTSPEFWTNLESNYRLHLARGETNENEIARRSRLYGKTPISEMINRSWIRASDSIDKLEREVCSFLEIDSLDESPRLAINFRHAPSRDPEVASQITWVKRVEHLARRQEVSKYDKAIFKKSIPALLQYACRAKDVSEVPSFLHSLGVHFIIVPQLPKTYIDGALFYVDDNPVIALTLRHDRIDAFWFTLMHEAAHIVAQHKELHLDQLYDGDERMLQNTQEQQANEMARAWLVEPIALDHFVKNTRPYFSRQAITSFATQQNRHPGIVLGQLQHDGVVTYKHCREMLVKVSSYLADWFDVSEVGKIRARKA